MNNSAIAFAKLAGVLKSVNTLLEQGLRGIGIPKMSFSSSHVEHYFNTTLTQLDILRRDIPDLYSDFSVIDVNPNMDNWFRLDQLETLVRYIEQALELRANSELATPVSSSVVRVFISHGSTNDWNKVQAFIEKDLEIPTLELAQEPNKGRSILQKLNEESSRCSFAVIVMTGDDQNSDGIPRARENVMHEIGFFQGKFGVSAVCLLHEEDTSIPSNIHGLVYIPFPKGYVEASLGTLMRELKAFYQ